MRLGIRRKLIGTLMLVGLLPLAVSLVVILGGGAAIQLSRIHGTYEDTAASCAEHISDALIHEEYEKLLLLTRLPSVLNFARQHSPNPPDPTGGAPIPAATAEDQRLDKIWPTLKPSDPDLAKVLQNDIAEPLRLLSLSDNYPRQTQVTDAHGSLIACDGKTDDFFQADETWWREAFNGGKGRVYIGSLTTATGDVNPRGDLRRGDPVIEIAIPIYDVQNGKNVIIGVLKDELAASWLLQTLHNIPAAKHLSGLTQLLDLNARKSVHAVYADGRSGSGTPEALRAEKFYFERQFELERSTGMRVHSVTLLLNDIVIGAANVPLKATLHPGMTDAELPNFAVIVSQPANVAMTPVYHLAGIVAAIGIALDPRAFYPRRCNLQP